MFLSTYKLRTRFRCRVHTRFAGFPKPRSPTLHATRHRPLASRGKTAPPARFSSRPSDPTRIPENRLAVDDTPSPSGGSLSDPDPPSRRPRDEPEPTLEPRFEPIPPDRALSSARVLDVPYVPLAYPHPTPTLPALEYPPETDDSRATLGLEVDATIPDACPRATARAG